ncbi:porin [Rufibacter glacialis]|uniref:Porin n=1 Tax=Rufibacter glacialis TaxID=1259555 RepID=A0A5M8QFN8_9BACT|nr:porin [Rufibacter glacialis]
MLCAVGAYCVGVLSVQGQNAPEYNGGLKIKLNDKEDYYVRFMFWNQIWARHTEQNPGTLVNNTPQERSFDIGARRLRLLAMAQLSPRFMIMTHFGINSQTFVGGGAAGSGGTGNYGAGKKPGMFFHDFTSEYTLFPAVNALTGEKNTFSLTFGAGLHYWLGVSRLTMASTTNFLTLDSPIFSFPTVDQSDQFVRMYGVYAKGKVDKLEYRLSVNKPFATNLVPEQENVAVDNNGVSKPSVAGYFEYQFLDQESNTLPFKVGTYLGQKRMFNLGVGFYTQQDGTKSLQNDHLKSHDIALLAGDVFIDLPFYLGSKEMALTSYSGAYRYDFGPNYLRHSGTMNLGTANPAYDGPRSISGPGNARPMQGTGDIYYSQAGLLLPRLGQQDKLRLQPFMAYTRKNLEALEKGGNYWDFGSNLFIQQHNAKVSFQYSLRPNYLATDQIDGNRGEFIVQFQTFL